LRVAKPTITKLAIIMVVATSLQTTQGKINQFKFFQHQWNRGEQ
jgi:hypothetical protein